MPRLQGYSALFCILGCLTAYGQGKPPESVPMDEKALAIDASYKANVRPIFDRKCANCHTSQTEHPWWYKIPGIRQLIDHDIQAALEDLDLSGGFPFVGHGTMLEDLDAIRRSIDNNTMPPLRYRLLHGGAALSATEKEIIRKWVDYSKSLLEPAPAPTTPVSNPK